MKFAVSAVLAAVAYAAAVVAAPGRSSICDIANARDAFAASPMAPNQRNLAQENVYTITSDSATYTPGQRIVFSMDGSVPFNGCLFYVSPTSDPSKRVGKFEIPTGMQNNAQVCQNSEFPESSLTHTAGQTYEAKQQIVFNAPQADHGELQLNVIIVVKMENGFGWGLWPGAVKLGSATPSLDKAPAPFEGTPVPNNVDSSVECPAAFTATMIRKCKVRDQFKTTIHMTSTVVVTETKTETKFETKTETVKETIRETCDQVLGNNEVPVVHETPFMPQEKPMHTPMPHETPAYGNDYKNGYDNNNYGNYGKW